MKLEGRLVGRYRAWRENPRFPIRWLTYKARIREDLKDLYEQPKAKEFFSRQYIEAVSAEVRRLEDRTTKLFALQFAISAFLVIGFVSTDASVSVFGVSLKNAAGVKEVLLALSATVSIALIALNSSKETLINIIQFVTEMGTDKVFVDFAKLAVPSSLNLKIYLARQYDRWVFSTLPAGLVFASLVILFSTLLVFIAAFSLGLSAFLFYDIYHHPTLGGWSTAILIYVSMTWLFGFLWFVRFIAPLPYRDKGVLKTLEKLKVTDPVAHKRLLGEIFGPKK